MVTTKTGSLQGVAGDQEHGGHDDDAAIRCRGTHVAWKSQPPIPIGGASTGAKF